MPAETFQEKQFKMFVSVVRGYQKCIDTRGYHFEHLLILANLKTKKVVIRVLVQKIVE